MATNMAAEVPVNGTANAFGFTFKSKRISSRKCIEKEKQKFVNIRYEA